MITVTVEDSAVPARDFSTSPAARLLPRMRRGTQGVRRAVFFLGIMAAIGAIGWFFRDNMDE
jgi:hypothetical protein